MSRLFAGIILFACAASVVAFAWITAPAPESPRRGPGSEPLRVDTVTVRFADGYDVKREFIGRVEARQEARLGFELPGKVASILVREGDRIDKGAPMATLDLSTRRARRTELVAALDEANTRLALLRIRRERMREARELNAVSSQDWDDADQAYRAQQAAVRRAEAAIATLDVELAKDSIRAPFDAVVVDRLTDHGEVVTAGQPIVALLERTSPEVRIGVSRDALESLAVDGTLPVRIGARTFDAVVRTIAARRDARSRSVDVVLRLSAELGDVRHGDLARVALSRRVARRGVWLPLESITRGERGLWSVYRVGEAADGERRIERRDVEVLHHDRGRVFVAGALRANDQIVPSGLHRVVPGLVVEAQTAEVEDDA